MPFQALPFALRANTGDPISKLLYAYLVLHSELQPNEWRFFAYADPEKAAAFCQVSEQEIAGHFDQLERQRLISSAAPGDDPRDKWLFVYVHLPISYLSEKDRKRIKCSPDQVQAIAERDGYRCSGCGEAGDGADLSHWDVDHIIPRSIGGADVEANCQLLCKRCNSRKGAKIHFVDFLGGR